ncbi:type II secretion system protein [uncultured Desulfosarcina sp.]|uniref:type II secretion system protein n=1 Tax=uncultured Desulfosarcina sp. TaxID=218289 RepID=UPI0029C84877|nr:type II secretion system protein [uncultured Desulfosarcina sp.]
MQKTKRMLNSNKGFTLLEILVVLTIMGFLIAMVAPRLAGISGSAVDTVCDTNQNRMVTYMASYFEQTNNFPDRLTNLVDRTDGAALGDAATYQFPAVSDDDPENGPETIASEFYERNHFQIHYLNDFEQKELKDMGLSTLLNLNAYEALNEAGDAIKTGYTQSGDVDYAVPTGQSPSMEEVKLAVDANHDNAYDYRIAVAMTGVGADAATGAFVLTSTAETGGFGEPDFFGRIVLGLGPECGLITSGVIGNAAHCPGGIQNADNATYNDYNLVLPRLSATVDRYDATVTGMDSDANTDGVQLAALSYDESWSEAAAYVIADNDSNYRSRAFTLDAMESWQYATQCPEGHMYPEDDGEYWAIDLNADGSIAAP